MSLDEEEMREALGKQMVSDLLEIAQLTQQPIKEMRSNANGVFEEVKKPVSDQDQNTSSK
ncbi:hypothetical protein [Acinetobacter sp. TSRC1-2]|uniref:hypothetical protein n=1 Tax=unclassified Acinetobacter TaxID=196816 RepID=UPI003CED7701